MMNRNSVNSLQEEPSSPSLSPEDVRTLVRLAPMLMLVISLGGCKPDSKLTECQIETARIEGILKGVGIDHEPGETGTLEECLVANERVKGVTRGAAMKSDEIKVQLDAFGIDVSFSVPAWKSYPELVRMDESGKNETLGLKLPPEPEIQPGNEWYNTLPRQVDKKDMVRYWLTKKANPAEGQWFLKSVVKISYYNDQIQVLQGKLSIVDAKIKKYADEIIRIDEYLAQQERQETQDEIMEAGIRERIEKLLELLVSLKGEGSLETDIDYRQTQYQIDQLWKQLSPATPASQDTKHITSWPTEPGGPSLPGQDLYVIRGAHRVTIRRIEQTEKSPIKDALSANQAYRDYWQKIDEEIRKPKK